MKKISVILICVLLCMVFFGCNNNSDVTSNVDTALVGSWQVDGGVGPEYYVFTEDSMVKIVRGSVYFEGEASFVSNGNGGGTYLSNFYYMSGELTYTFNGNTVTFDDGAGTTMTLVKSEYKAPELIDYEDFDSQNPLIGTWANDEYFDSYIFNTDGTALYYMEVAELDYTSYIEYTYTVRDDSLVMSYDAGDGVQETLEEFEISGDTLNILSVGEYTRQ